MAQKLIWRTPIKRKWKTFLWRTINKVKQKTFLWRTLKILNIITFPIQILFVIIAIILRDIVGAFVLRLGQLILGFLVVGGLLAGIIRLFAYIVTGY
ncbi:hypothetical protein Q4502_02040 [Mesomycoplasma ovipneumoniae]|uniref:hypothetical protein n=1 Tax=Mesomycoplasma ovipneumoniae TaxID=29562 RepID=UPI0026E2579D|nr:hypothetical protein [Mesomycoplasma ovipneumoniae]MDO6856483.1 hypothetical protein [Mesomycoplasma ovipneumoniae]